jgi:hypothetical protein
MSMDTKSNQIAYQVAWKGAVELLTAGAVQYTGTPDVIALADDLFADLSAKLEGFEAVAPAPSAPRQTAPQPRSDAAAPLLTDQGCPECATAGRTGVLLHNDGDTGPEWRCSLQERKKVGSKWLDVGDCTYTDWGKNGRF